MSGASDNPKFCIYCGGELSEKVYGEVQWFAVALNMKLYAILPMVIKWVVRIIVILNGLELKMKN